MEITDYHAKLFAHELTRRCASDEVDKLAPVLADAQVDLNPHQIQAALFAFQNPLGKGAILADEVGLGKTIEAALLIAQKWAEGKRRLLVVLPANLRKQWSQELEEKFHLPTAILETRTFNEHVKGGTCSRRSIRAAMASTSACRASSRICARAVIDLLSSYQIERHVQRERRPQANRLRKEVQLGADFQELWTRIKARTTYRVEFATDELIVAAAGAVKRMTKIQSRTILVNTGRLDVRRGGVETGAQSVREEAATFGGFVLPDLLGYLQNATELTRSTLLEILKRSGRLADVFVDAQTFLDHAVAAIQSELRRLLIDGIRYEKLAPGTPDSEWEMAKFEDGELLDYLNSLQTDPKKSLYEFIEYESEVERAFAKAMNERSDIRLFVKLPRWFVVDTPVGSYNPDWAIVRDDPPKVYMVRETKSTKDFRKRRSGENDKVRCGERHFETLGVPFDVVVDAGEV